MSRRPTSTSAFGASKRESHDATGFYQRFTPPVLSRDSELGSQRAVDKLIVGDSRHMEEVPDRTVALVVTSPPYFAGKEYEEALGEGGVPATYVDYLELLKEVFSECARKLEPGGRIAVNVANLGRRPYRSLSADVIRILQDDLRLLLRGEIIWLKQRGSSGSCAWGSFQSPANPVLRDLTERVIVASKGRFDRAVPARVRAERGLPSESSMTRDDFMENTLDLWEIPPESATRIGHPAPFPVELPARLIELYTYREDLVLDPFLGSGTTAVAALRSGRHYVGYDLDPDYVQLAETRLEQERRRPAAATAGSGGASGGAKEIARLLLESAGFVELHAGQLQPGGLSVDFAARDEQGLPWLFEVAGGFTGYRGGLNRADVFWKAIAKVSVLKDAGAPPLVLLTTQPPPPGSSQGRILRQLTGPDKPIRAVVNMLEPSGRDQLRALSRL
jgi:DNA modification methylase